MNRKLILFLVSIFMVVAVSAQQSRTNNDVVETVSAEQQVLEEITRRQLKEIL